MLVNINLQDGLLVLTPGDKHFTDDVNLAALKTVEQNGFFCQL